MKIVQKDDIFRKIVITLDKKVEAEALKAVTGQIVGSGTIRDVTTQILAELDKLKINSTKLAGTIKQGMRL